MRMRIASAVLAGALMMAGGAAAQTYGYKNPYAQQRQQQPLQPRYGSSYDYQTGNSYSYRQDSQGNTTVNGYNTQNGTMWNSRVKPNGDQTGTDAQGNFWNYNARTGTYYNSNGTTCYGRGASRTCY